MGFNVASEDGVQVWRPDPDSAAAHAVLLAWLSVMCQNFLPKPVTLSNWLKGNLGEAFARCLGDGVAAVGHRVFCANALDPFSGISKTEIDIVWLVFGTEPTADVAVLQEVKTTSDPGMSAVADLFDDYDKLFGTDIKRTMATRLQADLSDVRPTSAGLHLPLLPHPLPLHPGRQWDSAAGLHVCGGRPGPAGASDHTLRKAFGEFFGHAGTELGKGAAQALFGAYS
jgi:hypothetical protein